MLPSPSENAPCSSLFFTLSVREKHAPASSKSSESATHRILLLSLKDDASSVLISSPFPING